MSVLVVGSVALDSIETPHGQAMDVVGGSATHFSMAAAFFGGVRLVGVVGQDFPERHVRLLSERGVDLGGLVRQDGRSFRWHGRYSADMNSRETISVELNVFEDFQPQVPADWRDSRYVFLANGSPVTQASVLDQMEAPEFVLLDSMNLWIETQRSALLELLPRVDAVLLNDEEARLLTEEDNLVRAGREVLSLGPRLVILKKGEHGALVFGRDHELGVPVPAFPQEEVRDPTGAGDSFAGGLLASMARRGSVDLDAIKQGVVYGTILASFNVEDFGVNRVSRLSMDEIEDRRRRFLQAVHVAL